MSFRKFILIHSFSLLFINSFSQNYLSVKGVVVDQKTNHIIPYASISICNMSIGVISNENGEFVFKIPSTLSEQVLCVSSLGYNTYSQTVSYFSDNIYYTIKLETKVYNIKEVKIKSGKKNLSPIKIVQQAIDLIGENHHVEPYTIQGYYREYLNQGGNKYLNLLEAALVVKDRGFKANFFPYRANLLQIRYNKDYETDKDFQSRYTNNKIVEKNENSKYIPEHLMPILGGNELSILFAHDAIRRYNEVTYSYVNQFNKDFIDNHNFTLDSITYQEDIPIYCISFEYKENVVYLNRKAIVKSRIKGRMLIRSNSYAIERFEYVSYSINVKGKKNFEIIADYNDHNGKMYLNYLSFSNFFKQAITTKNAQYKIPIEKQPLEIKDIKIDNNFMIIEFTKNIKKLSALNKKNYVFDGYITKNNDGLSNQDTLSLSKYPDKITLLDEKTIKISILNIQYLIESNKASIANSINAKSLGNLSINNEQPATIEGNTIKCKNVMLTISGVSDKYGNSLNSLCVVDMFQFREFYVNEILDKNPNISENSVLINNERPLYYQNPKTINDFWEHFNYPIINQLQNDIGPTR